MNTPFKGLILFAILLIGLITSSCSQYTNQTLRVGIASDRYPWELKSDKGEGSGISVDLVHAFSKATNRNVELVWLDPNSLFDALDQSKVDCILSSLPIDPNRFNDFIVSDPYTKVFDILLFRPNSEVKSKKDLNQNSIKIAVVSGTYHERLARSNFSNAEVIAYSDYDHALSALKNADADVYIDDALSIVFAYSQNSTTLQINPAPISDDFQYFAVYSKPGNEKLISDWNNFFSEARSQKLFLQLEDKYLTPLKPILDEYDLPLSL